MAKQITSINELAELVGKSAPAVQKWVKHLEWTFGKPPWAASALPKMLAWARETLQEDRASGDDESSGGRPKKNADQANSLSEARRQKVLREAAILGMTIQERKGEVHPIAECEQQQVARVNAVKLALTTHVPNAIAQGVRDRERQLGRPLADLEFAKIARDQIEAAIVQHLAGGATA